MGFLSLGKKKSRYGIIIDIGSSSVLTAVVHSAPAQKFPTIVWAHREHASLKKVYSIEKSAKAVLATLMSSAIKLDKDGRAALKEYDNSAKLTTAQCSISAPWSYTISKTVTISPEKPIEITERVLDELIATAGKQVEEELLSYSDAADISLKPITQTTMDLLANGYRVNDPFGEQATSLRLTQATVVTQDYLTNSLDEVHHKLFPDCSFQSTSYIMLFYCATKTLFPHLDDHCLLHVTDEATEIGIVRDGSLTYSTHTPFGIFSLAREISENCNVPLNEALGHLKVADVATIKKNLPAKSHDAISAIFEAYQQKLVDLINETGDSLSIPKQILLQASADQVPLIQEVIHRAAKAATKVDHPVIPITAKSIDDTAMQHIKNRVGDMVHDTALLLSAEFFHKGSPCYEFKFL